MDLAFEYMHDADSCLYVCIIQIRKLEDWFKAAEAIRYATGKGSLDEKDTEEGEVSPLFEFNVSVSDLELLKSSKRQGPSKKFGDDSLQSPVHFYSNYLLVIYSHCLLIT